MEVFHYAQTKRSHSIHISSIEIDSKEGEILDMGPDKSHRLKPDPALK